MIHFLCQVSIKAKKYIIEFCTDSSVVFGVGAVSLSEEGSGLYPAQEGGGYVRFSACVRGNGCGSRTGSRVQHSIRGLHFVQDSTQVSGVLAFFKVHFQLKKKRKKYEESKGL